MDFFGKTLVNTLKIKQKTKQKIVDKVAKKCENFLQKNATTNNYLNFYSQNKIKLFLFVVFYIAVCNSYENFLFYINFDFDLC